MIDQRINSCLTFYQGKCFHFAIMKVCFLFPQILNAIDIELAEHNCLNCNEYVNRLLLSTKSVSERRGSPSKEKDYGFRNREPATP